jgi:hypothetical protein
MNASNRSQISPVPEKMHPPKSIGGKHRNIFFAGCAIFIPMVLLPAILLGIISHYRFQPDSAAGNLAFHTELDSSAYFVKYNPSTLATISSWSSSFALPLTGFSMILLSYPIARGLMRSSEMNKGEELLTPFQFSLLLGIG